MSNIQRDEKNYLISHKAKYNIELENKLNKLSKFLTTIINDGIIVAFSGGTDSAMLLWATQKVRENVGGKIIAVTQDSLSLPRKDLEESIEFTKSLKVEHKIVKGKEFDDPRYLKNDSNRCYYCRLDLFKITDEILHDGYKSVLYGYNHSDKGDIRPGHRAATENNILSPLADFEFTKEEIRLVLRTNDIEISDKPATPCLSSRVMTGIEIEEKDIENIEELEKILWNDGAKIFRIRICNEVIQKFLRIEASPNDLQIVIANKGLLVARGKELGYKWVTLDLGGYKLGGGTIWQIMNYKIC